MNTWYNLPNAKHIDRVLMSIKNNPDIWHAPESAAWDAAWHTAWGAAKDATRDSACEAACEAAGHAAWDAAWGAVLALIAYDDCAYLLDMKADQVKLLGMPAAVLLYPACLAFENE